MTYNQRDIAGILALMRLSGFTISASGRADALALSTETRLMDLVMRQKPVGWRRVYF